MLAVRLRFTISFTTWKTLVYLTVTIKYKSGACIMSTSPPYINHALKMFTEAWAIHSMSFMHDITPLQIWMRGMLTNSNSGDRITQELYHSETDYVSFV